MKKFDFAFLSTTFNGAQTRDILGLSEETKFIEAGDWGFALQVDSPLTSLNFVELVEAGWYTGPGSTYTTVCVNVKPKGISCFKFVDFWGTLLVDVWNLHQLEYPWLDSSVWTVLWLSCQCYATWTWITPCHFLSSAVGARPKCSRCQNTIAATWFRIGFRSNCSSSDTVQWQMQST